MRYTAKAQVGGKLAQVGARLIDAAAKQMADQFFGAFAARVGGPAAPEGEAVVDDLIGDVAVTAEAIEEAFAGRQGDAAAAEAHETLRDPVKRKLYDSLGHDEYVSRLKS